MRKSDHCFLANHFILECTYSTPRYLAPCIILPPPHSPFKCLHSQFWTWACLRHHSARFTGWEYTENQIHSFSASYDAVPLFFGICENRPKFPASTAPFKKSIHLPQYLLHGALAFCTGLGTVQGAPCLDTVLSDHMFKLDTITEVFVLIAHYPTLLKVKVLWNDHHLCFPKEHFRPVITVEYLNDLLSVFFLQLTSFEDNHCGYQCANEEKGSGTIVQLKQPYLALFEICRAYLGKVKSLWLAKH